LPWNPTIETGPRDTEKILGNDQEFLDHHDPSW